VRNFTFNRRGAGIVELFPKAKVYRDRLGFKLAGL
jgi:hypothetical protein